MVTSITQLRLSDYCFYLHKTDLLKHDEHARMSDSQLEQHIRQYIEAQTGEQVVFSWQGGEPTLMGLPFYERVVELQAKYAKAGQRIDGLAEVTSVNGTTALAYVKRGSDLGRLPAHLD